MTARDASVDGLSAAIDRRYSPLLDLQFPDENFGLAE